MPLYDWLFIAAGIASSLYIGLTWYGADLTWLGIDLKLPAQVMRQGNPADIDIVFGTVMIIVLLEAVRRTLGIIVPIIIGVFTAYAVFGHILPLQICSIPASTGRSTSTTCTSRPRASSASRCGSSRRSCSTSCCSACLRSAWGFGQFFVDIAAVIAGRYTGGLAKVSVVSSAFFGTISGSSIANTVSTGSLTIPNMKRMGYPPHLAGGVEAASSAGGQITPPIMGAAAFVMAEFLEVPYTTIVIAAIVPA